MSDNVRDFSLVYPKNKTERIQEYNLRMSKYFEQSLGTNIDKLSNFSKYVSVQELSRFLVKNEIFQKIENVHGHIIECGVFLGGGLMTWAQLSGIYEPYHYLRKIIGFDTFEGHKKISTKDGKDNLRGFTSVGDLACDSYDDLTECINIYQLTRPLGHVTNVELVKGDACKTIPDFIDENKHLVVALLYLDFDLYEPTKVALEKFVPRMPKGSVIVFDELNQPLGLGETLAVIDTLGLRNLRIEKTRFSSAISYAIL